MTSRTGRKNRKHPEKSKRPIASGELGIVTASISVLILFLGSATAGFYTQYSTRSNYTSVGLDLMELHGGLKFKSSITTKLGLAEVNTDLEIAWVQLYYQLKQREL